MRKPTRSNTNLAVHLWKKTRSFKFWILEEEGYNYLRRKNKGTDKLCELISCAVTAQLICIFDIAYADCWFSDAETQLPTLHTTYMYFFGIKISDIWL